MNVKIVTFANGTFEVAEVTDMEISDGFVKVETPGRVRAWNSSDVIEFEVTE